jgi:hypothetical protein
MASTDSNFNRAKQNNLSKNFVEDGSGTKEKSWTIDDLPVTVFRVSSGSSRVMH